MCVQPPHPETKAFTASSLICYVKIAQLYEFSGIVMVVLVVVKQVCGAMLSHSRLSFWLRCLQKGYKPFVVISLTARVQVSSFLPARPFLSDRGQTEIPGLAAGRLHWAV